MRNPLVQVLDWGGIRGGGGGVSFDVPLVIMATAGGAIECTGCVISVEFDIKLVISGYSGGVDWIAFARVVLLWIGCLILSRRLILASFIIIACGIEVFIVMLGPGPI